MENAILILTAIIAVLSTFIINNNLNQGGVRASALLSLIVGLLFYLFPTMLSTYLTSNIPLVFIGASFVGMVSSKVISNYILLIVSGAIFGIIYLNTGDFFKGYGGALGTTAAISVLVSISLALVARSNKIRKIRK